MQCEKSIKKICNIVFLYFFFYSNYIVAQTEFFNSKINFSQEQLSYFKSSLTLDDNNAYFIGNDFKLHVFDKKKGSEIWNYNLNTKTNNPVCIADNKIIIHFNIEKDDETETIVIEKATQLRDSKINLPPIETLPYIKNDILYSTSQFGNIIFAFNLKSNKLLWENKISYSGVKVRPYYFENKIIANAKSNSWITINYNGIVSKDECEYSRDIDTISYCTREFRFLNHLQKEIPAELVEKYFEEYDIETFYLKNYTILKSDLKMIFLDAKNKVKKEFLIDEIAKNIKIEHVESYRKTLKVDEKEIVFILDNTLIYFDYHNHTIIKNYNLKQWNPHQVVLEDNKLWLISKNNGELYGINLSN